ncbi:MAG: leucine-rich repeat protein, partial [Bacteroidaceae bacterium]|nr:leucine-rich repeat protein [Bacteroidaceae bacterium]
CSGLTSVTIGDGVTSIGIYAFFECYRLTSIEIPGSVTSIGDYAFRYCHGLTSVTSLATTAPALGSYAFDSISSGATLYYPAGSDYSSWEQYFANTETIYVQSKCGDNLTWVFNGGVLTISGTGAMWDYSYNNSAPWSSDEITHVIIEDGVTSIGNYAFYYCDGLTSIEIPGSVTSIGDYAFEGCSGLTSIEIPGSVTSIGNYAFYDCSGLASIEIPGSVTSIGYYAFYNCSGLTSIEIPGSVTSIGNGAFRGCDGLTSIVVAEENTVYDSRNNCNAIIETATNTLIQGCQNTIIPGSVTSIGLGAFYYCSGLTSIEIPGSVTSIGYMAFNNCSGLTSVTSLATTAPALGSAAFSDISSDATLYYPAGSDYSWWAQYFANTEEITEEFPEEEEVFGDLNGDGTISVSDIQVLVNLILSDAAAEDNPAADVNSDGTVSVSDIQVVVNRILGN